jgi:hypothetical protein
MIGVLKRQMEKRVTAAPALSLLVFKTAAGIKGKELTSIAAMAKLFATSMWCERISLSAVINALG